MGKASQLVAHRGTPLRYPENTLLSVAGAVEAGAKWLEIDIQLTADETPILYHDDTADRVSGVSKSVLETSLAELQRYGAFFPDRFGANFRGQPINTLRQLVTRMNDWQGVRLFVEVKQQSVKHFGIELVLRTISADLDGLIDRDSVAAIISKHDQILQPFRLAGWPIGWVVPAWNDANKQLAQELQPEYMFVKDRRIPADDKQIWQGRWDWVVYPVDNIDEAVSWRDRGMPFVETNAIESLIDAPKWI